ncbi:MAG TPA: S8 family serine peptidase [Candidatus Thermoplasmatota archaeon]|nr:S8 family serine peptidase [Candidatus Thermoplasmatota archaeon]
MVRPQPIAFAALLGVAAALAVTPDPGAPLAATSARWDAATWDGASWDGANWDRASWDGAQWDASNWDASNWDASNWDASNWDGSFEGYDPLYPYQWGLRAANVPGAWALAGPGSGERVVCVLDSGVDWRHPDLAPQMWRDPATGAMGRDLVDDDDDPMDVGGHGTHVASIAAARAGDGYGVAGVADARVMAVRVLDGEGRGTEADLAAGIRWCVDHGAHVLVLSLSTDDKDRHVTRAVRDAAQRGAVIVASVGAGACDACLSELARVPGVLGVTALAPDGGLAPFATWTKKTDLAAPGVHVPGARAGGGWVLGSGTSQAVPHVAGAAVLVWDASPHLDAKDVARLLRETATPSGALDAEAAVRAALRT